MSCPSTHAADDLCERARRVSTLDLDRAVRATRNPHAMHTASDDHRADRHVGRGDDLDVVRSDLDRVERHLDDEPNARRRHGAPEVLLGADEDLEVGLRRRRPLEAQRVRKQPEVRSVVRNRRLEAQPARAGRKREQREREEQIRGSVHVVVFIAMDLLGPRVSVRSSSVRVSLSTQSIGGPDRAHRNRISGSDFARRSRSPR